ncbi:unnamed protein product [Candida verbasci]|uniref:Sugar phosphate transporter domain-containing protein n=1 Tax=Candida verbasci TaxID=1227364 RepID=A0A9W4TVT1_9ASCO|nr:unnamed protein product [Candida verbasci]
MSSSSSIIPPISIKTVVTCLLWYIVSSITSQLTKLILTKFPFALFLSQCQFLIGAFLAYTFISIIQKYPTAVDHFPPGSVPSREANSILSFAMFLKIFPLGLFQFVGKYLSLTATSLIPLPTISSVKALSPLLIVLGYRIIYKVIFPIVTYLSLAPLLIGVILIITSDSIENPNSDTNLLTNENNELDEKQIHGIILCLLSTIVFAAQNIYGKQLITWDNQTKNEPNPASLVLNTDLTRPSTPMNNGSYIYSTKQVFDSDKLSPDYFKLKTVRQRSNSIKLPYSTSDLTLDEMKENHILAPPMESYQNTVNQNKMNIYNPFGFIVSKFDLDKVSKPDKLTLIFYCSVIGFTLSIGGFVFNELPQMYLQFTRIPIDNDLKVEVIDTSQEFITIMVLILLDSLSHFAQTLLAFHLLGSIPALSYSIASMLKRIVLITTSIIFTIGYTSKNNDKWLGKITIEQLVGLLLIGFGLYCYDKWGSRSLKPDRS